MANDDNSTRQRFSDTQINQFINEGQQLFDIESLCNYKSYSFSLALKTTYYSLPSDYINVTRVTKDYMQLPELTPEALTSRSGEWEDVTGTPIYYFINFSTRGKIGMYPYPASSSDLGTVRLDYIAYSSALSSDSDTPFNGYNEFSAYSYSLVYYAAYKMSVIDERTNLATIFFQQFDATTKIAGYFLSCPRKNSAPMKRILTIPTFRNAGW